MEYRYTSRENNSDVEIFVSHSHWGYLKERICSLWEQILSFKSSPIFERFLILGSNFLSASWLPLQNGHKIF